MDKELAFLTELLAGFLSKEEPRDVAQIISRLDTTLSAVLRQLPGAMRGEVVMHLLQLSSERFGLLRWTVKDLGGIEVVADIINRSSSSIEKQVLDYLDKKDPALAEDIRNEMFTFEDIAKMPDQDIQALLCEVDQKDLIPALKGTPQQIRERILSTMSERIRTFCQEELHSIGPVGRPVVEDAQIRIVQQLRQLEAMGKVIIRRGDGGVRDCIL